MLRQLEYRYIPTRELETNHYSSACLYWVKVTMALNTGSMITGEDYKTSRTNLDTQPQ